ncbi:hypothetical protein ACWEPL_50010 [Nonomuraea sp. NPDC004186]
MSLRPKLTAPVVVLSSSAAAGTAAPPASASEPVRRRLRPPPGGQLRRGARGGRVNGSQYVRLPITFPSATSMSWHSQTTIEVAIGVITGSGATPSYRTTARHSGEYRDVSGAPTADGADIQQWTRTSS